MPERPAGEPPGEQGPAARATLAGLAEKIRHPWRRVAQVVFTGVLLLILLAVFDWRVVVALLRSADPASVAGVLLCVVVTFTVGAWDLWILLGAFARVPYSQTLRLYVVGVGSFLVVPGGVGDAVLIIFLRRMGIPYANGTTAYLVDKLVTLIGTLLFVLVFGVRHFAAVVSCDTLISMTVGAALLGVAISIVGWRTRGAWSARFSFALSPVMRLLQSYRPRVAANALGTAVKLLVTGISFWLAFFAIGSEVAFPVVLGATFIGSLVAYVPVAFNGIGTVEFAAVSLYALHGIPEEAVLAVYLIVRVSVFSLAMLGSLASLKLLQTATPID